MRIRSIKPEFFLDDDLADLGLVYRLAFVGLWCLADKEGRLEDSPRKIKAQIFPYENVPMEKILNELTVKPFIVRYEVEGKKYIQILNFLKHQRPHHTEQESRIPPFNGELTVKQPFMDGEEKVGREGKGKEGKGKEGKGNIKDQPSREAKTPNFSEDFVKKAEKAKSLGLNIYALAGKFYKESKRTEKLPEDVLNGVLDTFLARGESLNGDAWPYFIKVLKSESEIYTAEANEKEGDRLKNQPIFVGDILSKMMAEAMK